MKFGQSTLCNILVLCLFAVVVENNLTILDSLQSFESIDCSIEKTDIESENQIEEETKLCITFSMHFLNNSREQLARMGALDKYSFDKHNQSVIEVVSPPPEV